jgi:hypothetical protein
MEHLWFNLGGCAGGTQLAVQLRGSAARACLMDADEYQAYLDGDEYEYHAASSTSARSSSRCRTTTTGTWWSTATTGASRSSMRKSLLEAADVGS